MTERDAKTTQEEFETPESEIPSLCTASCSKHTPKMSIKYTQTQRNRVRRVLSSKPRTKTVGSVASPSAFSFLTRRNAVDVAVSDPEEPTLIRAEDLSLALPALEFQFPDKSKYPSARSEFSRRHGQNISSFYQNEQFLLIPIFTATLLTCQAQWEMPCVVMVSRGQRAEPPGDARSRPDRPGPERTTPSDRGTPR